jgi:hypothetical protein
MLNVPFFIVTRSLVILNVVMLYVVTLNVTFFIRSVVMFGVVMLYAVKTECFNFLIECSNAKCRYAVCCYAECHFLYCVL